MFGLKRPQTHPIGLDIGHDSVKMIQLERSGETLSVVAAACAVLPTEARANPTERIGMAAGVIRQMFREHAFHGRRVVTSLPREMVQIRYLRLPLMPADQLEAAVNIEAKSVLPFNPSEAQLEFLPVGEVRQGTESRQEVILLAARNYDITAFIETLGTAGVELAALDVEPCAMYRAIDRFIRRRDDEQDVHVLVDVGVQGSRVVIGRGREISFIKSIEIGGRHLQEAVSRSLGISLEEAQSLRRRISENAGKGSIDTPAEEKDHVRQAAHDATRGVVEDLAREISRCLRYYSVTFRGQRPTRLRLIGGEATDPQLLATLDKMLAIPAEVARPLLSFDTRRMKTADRPGPLAEWGLAVGLALKCVQGTFGPRDGKPRDPQAPKLELAPETADVPDLSAGLRSAANVIQATANHPDGAAARSASAYRDAVVREVSHA